MAEKTRLDGIHHSLFSGSDRSRGNPPASEPWIPQVGAGKDRADGHGIDWRAG